MVELPGFYEQLIQTSKAYEQVWIIHDSEKFRKCTMIPNVSNLLATKQLICLDDGGNGMMVV